MLNDREYCLWLSGLRSMSPADRQKLILLLGSPADIYNAEDVVLLHLLNEGMIKPETLEEIKTTRNEEALKLREREIAGRCGILALQDPEYPELLKEIPDPPVVLYYRGDISLLNSMTALGVVGSRTPSIYGNEIAKAFVPVLAGAGLLIVSGLAMGIDTAAHNAALVTGKTVAVLGGGVDICYPQRNFRLYEELCSNHLVISEYPPGVPPLAIQFPQRNRIISGISKGLLVIEARKRSGTLITADAALDQNRSVYAVPGRIGDALSEGTNRLIRMGAMLVQGPEDILEDLGVGNSGKKKTKREQLTPEERSILKKLSHVPVFIDDLFPEDTDNWRDKLSILSSMEARGLISQPIQGYYVTGSCRM